MYIQSNLEKVSERIKRLNIERQTATWTRLELIDKELEELKDYQTDELLPNF
ncbi:MAG: hypothetical protein HRT61_00995 [Ekhidna sp.]|nr:hypothetical protein [Ekhidna sp.]